MNIVFWGEEHDCGTTAHMFAVAGMLSALCPHAEIGIGAPQKGRRTAFHFYDGGTGLSARRVRMLRAADLVVVNLKPEEACVQQFFMEHSHIAKNKLILLSRYYEGAVVDCGYLEHFYRVEPERLGGIPYNNGFYQALRCRRTDDFIRGQYASPENLGNEQFLKELCRIAAVILEEKEKNNQTTNAKKQMKRESE